MSMIQKNECAMFKALYEEPTLQIIEFYCKDIISTSETGDENQGEWDPQ